MVIECECLVNKMAEYPTRSCGPCPALGQFAAVQEKKSPSYDYFAANTVPEPKTQLKDRSSNPDEIQMGVPSSRQSPDLQVSPFQNSLNIDKINSSSHNLNNAHAERVEHCPGSCLKDGENRNGARDKMACCHPTTARSNSRQNISHQNQHQQEEAPIKGILKNKSTTEFGTNINVTNNCACAPSHQSSPHSKQQISFSLENNQQQPGIEMHATAGRSAPDAEHPSQRAPVPSDLRPVPAETPPCYLPQPEDVILKGEINEMGPTGVWATGKADWAPLAGMTGTRPVVDKYSITRFSEGEWRIHNKDVLDTSVSETHRSNLIDWNSRQCLEQTQADVDKNQEDNTKRLNQRQMEILRWKCELERAISAASEEISFMEEQRARLKTAAAVLQMPESIAGECLERRTGRLDTELVRDEVEEELIKELSLCAEIRDIFARTLKDVENQLLEDKTAKQRLEYDWSDKKDALEIDATNVALNSRSTVLLFKPGAVIFPDSQSTPEYWQHFTKETLLESEATRQRSAALRGTLDAILINASRDLRTQADKVEMALARRIACMEEVTRKLESELKEILRKLAEVEDLLIDLRAAIRRMDTPMKKAQTRLDNRLLRPRVENCRDAPHFGLINEVKSISDDVAALQAQYNQADKLQTDLTTIRSRLEREIMLKMKTLEIDRERTRRIRSYYPSATALAGH